MTQNPNSISRVYIIIFIITITCISYKVYERVIFMQKQRRQLINNFYDADLENSTYEETLQKKYKERRLNARKIMKMQAIIKQVNLKQKIYNEHLQPPHETLKYIILIQVHSDVYLFRQLLMSLSAAHSINKALLIFSHDVFDPEINKAVHSVTFAKYMQIFYPYSIQLHPNVFPGNCRGGKICDQYKSRDPIAAQKKHHWWWQMNQVFDYLNVTQNFNRTILLLEEDNYVSIDSLIILTWLENAIIYHCPFCEMVSLGVHDPHPSTYLENATITVEMWGEMKSNIGIGFTRSTWESIKNWSEDFCHFDDYTWDNSLKYIGSKHMDSNFYLTAIDGPRVFRIGKCDEKDISCKIENKVKDVKEFLGMVNEGMFPWTITTQVIMSEAYYTVKPRGSFSDERDEELCMYFSKNNVWY